MGNKRIKRRILTPDKVHSTLLPHVGNLDAPVLMVLDPPVGNPNTARPLDKAQMDWFAARASKHGGFRKSDVCIISASTGVTHDVWQQNKLISAHLKEQRSQILKIIKANKPKLILPFGAKACQQIFGKGVQITKVRGQPVQDDDYCNGTPILPMLSPFYAQRQPENEAAFVADMQTAGRIYKSGYDLDASTIDYKHNYRWCYDLDFLIKKRPKRLSVDVETLGLYPFDPDTRLLTVQLCWKPGEVVIVPIDYDKGDLRHHNFIKHTKGLKSKLLAQIRTLMEDRKIQKIGQNFKFDWLMLHYKAGIQTRNYAHDTQLLAHLHDENQRRINIDDLVRQHVPEMAGFNDKYNNDPDHHNKSRMDLFPPDKMLPYACGDADAALRLLDSLLDKIKEDKGDPASLWDCYSHVTMPAQRAFCHIELNGFAVSHKKLREFEHQLRMRQKRERIFLMKKIPKSIKEKWKDSGVGLKVTRPAILRDWLYLHPDGLRLKPMLYTKTKEPSISSKDALPYYVADNPIVLRLIDYIKNDKLLNTYAKGFHKYIYDGLVRPSYSLTRTVTGRSSSQDPNGQNFPKRGKLAKEYRKIFEAPPGWVYISCDLSQAELRIAAMMSGDYNMLRVYAEGGDIHRTTAAGTMGISVKEFNNLPADIQVNKRFQAKAVNFGFLYGMWWVKFRAYAKTEYGIEFTEQEAKEIRENFFNTYPMLAHYHNDTQEYVSETGYIRTFDGRIRHLPNVFSPDENIRRQAMRQAINSPVQAIASDLGLMTLGRLVPYLNRNRIDWLKPCGFIHDAIVCLVREERVAEGCALVKRFMENNPLEEWFGWVPEIPITADAEIGRNLSQTYELDPEQFVHSRHHKKTYCDLLNEERDKLIAKAAKTDDKDRRAEIEKKINAVETDIKQSGKIRSHSSSAAGTLNIKRGPKHNASRKATSRTQESRVRVRRAASKGSGGNKQGKPPKDRAA